MGVGRGCRGLGGDEEHGQLLEAVRDALQRVGVPPGQCRGPGRVGPDEWALTVRRDRGEAAGDELGAAEPGDVEQEPRRRHPVVAGLGTCRHVEQGASGTADVALRRLRPGDPEVLLGGVERRGRERRLLGHAAPGVVEVADPRQGHRQVGQLEAARTVEPGGRRQLGALGEPARRGARLPTEERRLAEPEPEPVAPERRAARAARWYLRLAIALASARRPRSRSASMRCTTWTPGWAIAVWSRRARCSAWARSAMAAAVAPWPVAMSAGTMAMARRTRPRGAGSADIAARLSIAGVGRPECTNVSASSVISSSRIAVSVAACSAARITSSASSARFSPHIRLRTRIAVSRTSTSAAPSGAPERSTRRSSTAPYSPSSWSASARSKTASADGCSARIAAVRRSTMAKSWP